jgi:GWxTD domain-containing protein
LLPALNTPIHAQSRAKPTTAAIDSLVHEALALAGRGDTTVALELLERATDQSPRHLEALYWRGLMLSRTTTLSMGDTPRRFIANRMLSRANDIDPTNSRYLVELARIRLKTPILRVEAERTFRKALAVAEASGDPAQIAEVAYEMGEIKHRRYLTGRDRWMYTTTNVIFDPIASRARLHYTREFLENLSQPIANSAQVDRVEAEELFRKSIKAQPLHARAVVSLMGILYDQKRYWEMQSVAAPILATDSAAPRVVLAAGLAAYRLNNLTLADTLFTRALARFPEETRKEITHLGRITRVGDSVRIEGLNPADRARTDSAFWEAADPLLSTPVNEARLEFLARTAYADLRFTDDDTRQIGWRTDRGQIITRYGEPPVVATFPPTTDADARDAVGRVITVWFYPRTEVEFVFTGPPAMNVALFAGNHRGFAEEQRNEAPFLLDNVPISLASDTVPMQVARFRGNSATTAQLMVAASIPTERFYRDAEIDVGALEVSVRLGPLAALRVAHLDTVDVPLPMPRRTARLWVDTLRADANYRVRVEARDPALQNAHGRAQTDFTTLPYDTTKLSLSDLVFANRLVSPTAVVERWDRIGLVPRGDLVFPQRDTMSVYWENYGLQPDADGRVKYELHILVTLEQIERGPGGLKNFFGNLSDAVGLSPEGEEQLGLRYTRNEPLNNRDRVPDLVTLGLGSSPAGRYRLELIITDRNSGQVSRTSRQFHLKSQ